MSKLSGLSKCCEAKIIGNGGAESIRTYKCTNCKKECDSYPCDPPPPADPKFRKKYEKMYGIKLKNYND